MGKTPTVKQILFIIKRMHEETCLQVPAVIPSDLSSHKN